ncbi:MAG: glycosyltransferase family 4 protein [bacterium]
MYPPVDSKENYFCEEYSDYYYFPSRFAYNKRQHLVIEALKYAKGNFKVIMTGQIEEKYFRNYIKPLLNDPQINQRLEIMEYVDETIKRKLYARAIAVIFTPFDEDYGYVTLEAFYSSKSVITVNNSGACLEFVQNNKTGIVCKPSPESIAKAMDFLYENKSIAIQMGKNAKQFIEGKNISWEHTIQRIINYNPIQKIINSIFSWFPNK